MQWRMISRFPPLHCRISTRLMTAMGHTRPSRDVRCMAVLPPKADVHLRSCFVAFVPTADSCTATKRDARLHDYSVVGGGYAARLRHSDMPRKMRLVAPSATIAAPVS